MKFLNKILKRFSLELRSLPESAAEPATSPRVRQPRDPKALLAKGMQESADYRTAHPQTPWEADLRRAYTYDIEYLRENAAALLSTKTTGCIAYSIEELLTIWGTPESVFNSLQALSPAEIVENRELCLSLFKYLDEQARNVKFTSSMLVDSKFDSLR